MFGLTSTCNTGSDAAGRLASAGLCSCSSSETADTILAGLGDAICLAVNAGLNGGVELGTLLIPVVGEEGTVVQDLFKLGKKFVKKGAKSCDFNVCPDHVFTVVDPSDVPSGFCTN
jgi:hypothetical protein